MYVQDKREAPSISDFPRYSGRLGIVGPGLMGLGLCHSAAAAGLQVTLAGRDAASGRRGLERLGADLQQRVARGRLDAPKREALLSVVSVAPDDGALSHCDLVVEAVAEDRAVKEAVLRRIEAVAAPDAIIATNTSGLPVTGLATALARPGRFIGLHFFSPVDRMALVEVVVGRATERETIDRALDWVRRLGKTPIVVRDGPGFFTSRVFAAYLDEALAMLAEGVASDRIESAAMQAGLPVGPLAMLDETGIALNRQQALQARADGLDARACRALAWPVLDHMVTVLGRRGRREGAGFYDYPASGPKQLWTGLAGSFPLLAEQPSLEAAQRRLLNAQAMEAARCLEDGTVASAEDADAASVLGLGFPRGEGGVLAQVQRRGVAEFVAECDALADAYGDRFRPSAWLRELAASGRGFGSGDLG